MSDYTPTTQAVRLNYITANAGPYRGGEANAAAAFDRWMADHDAEKSAEREAEGEHVFIERYGVYHAEFGGLGGDATSLTITREAWKSMGEPDVLAVSWVPVEQEGESNA